MTRPTSDPLDLGKLSAWAPELARTFVALASDIAIVIDADGIVRTVEQGDSGPVAPDAADWVGRSWVDTVSGETRGKIEKLLKEASSQGVARRREVNHPLHAGGNLPIAYTAVRLGAGGPVLAVGRDLRAVAAIQERFIESQQDLERGYWNARQAESQYRQLFQVATDAVMVIEPESLVILDANPAAMRLFASVGDPLIGKHASAGFAHYSRGPLNELFATARGSGQGGEIRARLLGNGASTSVAATSFRAEHDMRLLVRVRAVDAPGSLQPSSDAGRDPAAAMVASGDDAAAVTDSNGRIQLANPAFLRLLSLSDEGEAKGRPLLDWIGSPEQPLARLIAQVRRQGVVRRFDTVLRPTRGPAEPVEVAATLLDRGRPGVHRLHAPSPCARRRRRCRAAARPARRTRAARRATRRVAARRARQRSERPGRKALRRARPAANRRRRQRRRGDAWNRARSRGHVTLASPAFGQADLTNCERELIHLAGSVQPHGALLVLEEPTLRIVQASANVATLLGAPVESLLRQRVAELGGDIEARIRALAPDGDEPVPLLCSVAVGGEPRAVRRHRPSRRRRSC